MQILLELTIPLIYANNLWVILHARYLPIFNCVEPQLPALTLVSLRQPLPMCFELSAEL
jgi:hypothetical protein